MVFADTLFFYLVFILCIYILASEYGRVKNALFAKKWCGRCSARCIRWCGVLTCLRFEFLAPFLAKQFAQVGIEKNDGIQLHNRNPAHFISYVTGRIHIEYANIQFVLRMRQNILSQLRQAWTAFFTDKPMPQDRLYVDMVVADNVFDVCVFAIVNKACMRWLREKYYHLSFTKVAEIPILPETYVVMSESSEITSTLLENNDSFIQSIVESDSELEYFIVSDQPPKQPKSPDQKYQKIISFCIRLPSLQHSDRVISIVLQCITFVDLLADRAHWRSNISQKLKAAREEVNRKLKKLQDEEQLTKVSKKKAEKDRLEKERVRNMSSQEQRKYLDKEREKKYKKQMKIIKV
ncbi:hypothetical protein PORY_000858 [Pneumocystis oryctolagi]|uniref:Uncharacterized protein n=1 Tax=Pneumocystis oryctolagi TaxID=42067 RepID=A0ACB7CG29_9ASCO|nr:hypothetical protein PORY_000858 [Pneumocystis oryctolagi]